MLKRKIQNDSGISKAGNIFYSFAILALGKIINTFLTDEIPKHLERYKMIRSHLFSFLKG